METLYDVCFPGEQGFRKWIFDRVWRPEYTLLAERGGTAVSSLMDIPVTLRLEGERFDAHYIYAAGTLPAFRGQGLMAGLLGRAFADGAARGQHFSVLITGDDSLFDFYRPLGYRTLSAVSRRNAEPKPISDGWSVRAARRDDVEAMIDIYESETAGALAIFRDCSYYELMLELYGDQLVVLQDANATVKAYAFTEERDGKRSVSEMLGARKRVFASALCNQMGEATVFQSVADDIVHPNGCIRALTTAADEILARLSVPPYINMMFN